MKKTLAVIVVVVVHVVVKRTYSTGRIYSMPFKNQRFKKLFFLQVLICIQVEKSLY